MREIGSTLDPRQTWSTDPDWSEVVSFVLNTATRIVAEKGDLNALVSGHVRYNS